MGLFDRVAGCGGTEEAIAIDVTRRTVLAVFFAAVIVTGAITPVLAVSSQPPGAPVDGGVTDGSLLDDEKTEKLFASPPALQKTWSRYILSALSNESGLDYGAEVSLLNESVAGATGPSRVQDEQVFELDREMLGTIHFQGDDRQRALAVLATRLVVSADNETARQRVADARWAIEHTRSDLPTGVERSASAHVRNAERAHARGLDRLERAAGRDTRDAALADRAKALQQFRLAWKQATKALDAVDAATAPEVTITTRGDPVRNGSEPLEGQIRGRVFDPRPHELANATVTVDGSESVTTPLDANGTRLNATFAVNVSLSDRVTSVEVAVREPGSESAGASPNDARNESGAGTPRAAPGPETARNGADRTGAGGPPGQSGNGGPPDHAAGGAPSGNDRSDDPRVGSDVVRFDGDRVPDTFETEVLGTDPQDPDSDSSKTSADESDDGVIDGLEDFDGDGVSNFHEGKFGADPFSTDGDGDGLPDAFEVEVPQLDPQNADSDGDGVPDDQWDIDEDGLSNGDEYDAGTRPQIPDTDRDELNDSRELAIGTDPLEPDTDGDGLLDGEEIRLGTDPLAADSDGDGVPDGESTFATEASNESLGVDVSLSTRGGSAGNVTIENGTEPRFQRDSIRDARVTDIVNLESERSFESANVTFSYDESALGETNESDLVVFRHNETADIFVPLNTTVDEDANTVTGETAHFSRFVVFDVRNWGENFFAHRPEDGSDEDEIQPLDVVFVIDSSGSMSGNDPSGFRKQAAKEFVGALLGTDRAGVVDFDGNAHVAQSLTGDFGAVNVTIDSLDASGGTNIGAGVQTANQHFDSASNDSRAQIAVLLTDGQGGGGPAQARDAAAANRTIYTIGFGGADEQKLRDIADITGGNYSYVDDASELPNVFSRVAEDVGAADSDGDGIPDVVERRGVPTSHGRIQTDPHSVDTDGDGLTDDAELGPSTTWAEYDPSLPFGVLDLKERMERNLASHGIEPDPDTTLYLSLESYPDDPDSDGDGLSDHTETTEQTTVLRTTNKEDARTVIGAFDDQEGSETTRSELLDAFESVEASSDPLEADSDDDGMSDEAEWDASTHPDDADTDGDGVEDGTELDEGGDPTLHDAVPPEIRVRYSGYEIPENSLDTRYWVGFYVQDSSGVERVELVKDGDVEKGESYGDTRVLDRLEFTERLAESDADIDTSSVRSTFTSFGAVLVDTASSIGESVADAAVGTGIYVEARDGNDNTNRVLGVKRPGFYGEIAGEIFTGTIVDYEIARSFGMVSGLSASFGVFVQDIASLIDDPDAIVEGLQALVDLLREEGLGAGVTLVQLYVDGVQNKQQWNNPYDRDDQTALYNTFETNWYTGYAAGFVSKLVLGGAAWKSAKGAIQGTGTYARVANRLSDTRALQVLQRASTARQALQSRAIARLLLLVDDSAEPLVRNADTVGEVFYRWQMVQRIDTDLGDLPDAQRENLVELLVRTGDDGAEAIDGVSDATRRAMADGGDVSDRQFRSAIARAADSDAIDSYGRIDEAVQHIESLSGPARVQAREFVGDSGGYGVRTVLRFRDSPDADLEAFVRKIERIGPDQQHQIARMAVEADDGVRLVDDLGYGQLQRIADRDTEMAAVRLSDRGIDVDSIERLVNEGVDLQRVNRLLNNEYQGWSERGTGMRSHYDDHVVEQNDFGGPSAMDPDGYDRKARSMLNNRDSEIYYQIDNDNLAVYDPSENSYAAGNINGRVQTLFEPDTGRQYVRDRVNSRDNIRLK